MILDDMMLSHRVMDILPSAALAIDAMAKQLKKEGKDVVIFGAGEPDFNTPENVKKASMQYLNKDNYNIRKFKDERL